MAATYMRKYYVPQATAKKKCIATPYAQDSSYKGHANYTHARPLGGFTNRELPLFREAITISGDHSSSAK